MSDNSSKDIDRMFQEGADQYDFSYDEQAWTDMQSQLDKDKRRRRLFWWCFFGFFILILVMGIYWFPKQSAPKAKAPIVNQLVEPATQPETSTESQTAFTPKEPGSAGPNNTTASPLLHPSETTPDLSSRTSNADQADTIAQYLPKPGLPIDYPVSTRTISGSEVFAEAPDSSILIPSKNQAVSNDKLPTPGTLSLVKLLPFRSLSLEIHSEIGRADSLAAFLPNLSLRGKKSSTQPVTALFAGAVLGTEMTSVKTDHFSMLNWKAGAQLEFFYQQRYSISMGAHFIQKNYEAGRGAYIPPYGFWTRKIAPSSVIGTCNVMELPVLVGYYPKGYSQSGFLARAGFISYLMLKERYQYYYDVPDTDLIREWGTENENRHWFAVGQFSLGYSTALGPAHFLQIEPYIKIPLEGIGHGQVELWSIGVNAEFQFLLSRHRY